MVMNCRSSTGSPVNSSIAPGMRQSTRYFGTMPPSIPGNSSSLTSKTSASYMPSSISGMWNPSPSPWGLAFGNDRTMSVFLSFGLCRSAGCLGLAPADWSAHEPMRHAPLQEGAVLAAEVGRGVRRETPRLKGRFDLIEEVRVPGDRRQRALRPDKLASVALPRVDGAREHERRVLAAQEPVGRRL